MHFLWLLRFECGALFLWECQHPRLVAARRTLSSDAKVAAIEEMIVDNFRCLSTCLRYGIPPPLALLPHSPWWTNTTPSLLDQQTRQVQACFGVEHAYLHDALSWSGCSHMHTWMRRELSRASTALASVRRCPRSHCLFVLLRRRLILLFLPMAPFQLLDTPNMRSRLRASGGQVANSRQPRSLLWNMT